MISKFSSLIVAMVVLAGANARAGAVFDAAKGACLATGGNDRFVIYKSGNSTTCAQTCATATCGVPATCVKGFTVFGASVYTYGSECSAADPSGGQASTGKICCCTGTQCAQPVSLGTAYSN
jgi:hypothetical protein